MQELFRQNRGFETRLALGIKEKLRFWSIPFSGSIPANRTVSPRRRLTPVISLRRSLLPATSSSLMSIIHSPRKSVGVIPEQVPTLIGSRWKGKGYAENAAKNPMSEYVKQLQSSLIHSRATAMLSSSVALIKANKELTILLEQTCFGRQITTSGKDEHWFQLSSEETFYMHHALQSLVVVNHNEILLSGSDLWNHFKKFKATFPELYISYAHLRGKNWVVRAGAQYGVDFVAYRHHPSLVHSDYAVIVLQERDDNMWQNERLRAWEDLHCTIRVCGSVVKTLLVLFVNMHGRDATLHSCFKQFTVEERVITRWVTKQCEEE